jgi:valyl-tRNA synthetase
MWHPFMPFVTEKMWNIFYGNKNLLIIQKWPKSDKKLINKKAEKEFEKISEIIYKIRNIRSSYHVSPAAKLGVYADKIHPLRQPADGGSEIIEKLARVKIESGKIQKQKLMEISVPGLSLKLDIAGLIDTKKEIKSIEKEIQNLEEVIDRNEAMLKNKSFIKNAPKEIVEANRQKLAEYQKKLKIQKTLQKNLEKLA